MKTDPFSINPNYLEGSESYADAFGNICKVGDDVYFKSILEGLCKGKIVSFQDDIIIIYLTKVYHSVNSIPENFDRKFYRKYKDFVYANSDQCFLYRLEN